MKRIGAFSLAIFIFVLSVFSVIPIDVYADDNKTVLPFTFKQLNNSVGAGMSASDANAAVTAHKDIYTSDGTLLFIYNPSNSYNWTTSSKAYYLTLNYSDEQLKNILMSKNPLSTLFNVWGAALSNNNGIRAFCAGLGTIFSGNSDMGTKVLDTLSGNYNYLDSLNYDEDSQTITMSNDNGSVDKLREDIKNYWYNEKGILTLATGSYHFCSKSTFLNSILKNGWFDYEEDYSEYFNAIKNTDYSFVFIDDNNSAYVTYLLNKSDISYFYLNHEFSDYYSLNFANSVGYNVGFTNITKRYKIRDFYTDNTAYDYSTCDTSVFSSIKFYFDYYKVKYSTKQTWDYKFLSNDGVTEVPVRTKNYGAYYIVCDDGPLIFKNEASMKAFIEGSDSFLASSINKVGEDLSFNIKDMNENLGSKMDELIDSINSGKGNMSADELQNAIDKGLEDLNKNTEDIKDNTSDILEVLKEQNQILLQILGVTEYIAYQTTKDDGSSYTKTDLTNTINKIYNGLGNAILYGKNTLTGSGDSSGAASQSYIVTREDFKLSNNIYTSSGSGVSPGTPVVAYSLDDCSVYDDSNDYDVGIATQDINNMDIHDGLFGKFPFSVPYQLYEWLQVLQADPVAPKLVYNYGFLLGHKDDQKYDLVIDFSIYEPWANVCKSFLRLSFTLLMAAFIFRHFSNNKGGGVL